MKADLRPRPGDLPHGGKDSLCIRLHPCSGGNTRQHAIAQVVQGLGVAHPALGLGRSGRDLKSLDAGFVPKLQLRQAGIGEPPAPPAVLSIRSFDIAEGLLKRVGHALRGTV